MVQMIEHRGRIVGELVAQRAHQGARIHRCLQAFTADVADHNEQRIVFQRQHLEEVAAHSIDGQVGAFEHEVAIRRKLGGNEQRLHAARSRDFSGRALFFLADADETVEYDRDETAEEDGVGDRPGAELNGTEMEAVRGELFRKDVEFCEIVDDGVGRIGRCGEEERPQHDAGLALPAAPGMEKQETDETAERDFGRNRENVGEFREWQHRDQGHKQNPDLHTAHDPAVVVAGKAKDEFERHRDEYAAHPHGEEAVDRKRHPCETESDVGEATSGDGQAQQGEPQIFGVMPLRKIQGQPQHGHAEKEKRDEDAGRHVLVPLAARRHREAIGDVGGRANLDFDQEAAADGDP